MEHNQQQYTHGGVAQYHVLVYKDEIVETDEECDCEEVGIEEF